MARPKAEQLELALGPYDNRKLFSDHFLEDRLPSWPEFIAVESQGLLDDLATLLDQERAGLPSANEAQTEERFIKPILERLGIAFTVQGGRRHGRRAAPAGLRALRRRRRPGGGCPAQRRRALSPCRGGL